MGGGQLETQIIVSWTKTPRVFKITLLKKNNNKFLVFFGHSSDFRCVHSRPDFVLTQILGFFKLHDYPSDFCGILYIGIYY